MSSQTSQKGKAARLVGHWIDDTTSSVEHAPCPAISSKENTIMNTDFLLWFVLFFFLGTFIVGPVLSIGIFNLIEWWKERR
jgi:hypothetical protein